VRAFFTAQSEAQLGDALARALDSEKVVLLVDGLDEATDVVAARTVATILATFAESRDPPSFSSRPDHTGFKPWVALPHHGREWN